MYFRIVCSGSPQLREALASLSCLSPYAVAGSTSRAPNLALGHVFIYWGLEMRQGSGRFEPIIYLSSGYVKPFTGQTTVKEHLIK